MKIPKIALIVSLLFVGVVLFLVAYLAYARVGNFQGSLIEPPVAAQDFELRKASGEAFRLSDARGKVVLIFFGYANCPDFCPSTLAEYKKIHENLGDEAENVEFVFITIDPERDTPEQIETFVSSFNPSFIGLSGSEEALQPVWDAYFVFREKQEGASEAGYLMAHTTRVYAVDKAGNLRLTYPFGMTAAEMTSDVRRLLAE